PGLISATSQQRGGKSIPPLDVMKGVWLYAIYLHVIIARAYPALRHGAFSAKHGKLHLLAVRVSGYADDSHVGKRPQQMGLNRRYCPEAVEWGYGLHPLRGRQF